MQPGNSYAHFDNFFALLQNYCPEVTGMTAFDRTAELLWQDGKNDFASDQLKPLVVAIACGDREDRQVKLDSGVDCEIVRLVNEFGGTALVLCLSLAGSVAEPGIAEQ